MYKYGRGMWKNIESGNELSWVIGNGIGGYANHTVAGGGAQAFHGYLIASLNAPVNRKLILTRTQEQIIINDREYDLTSQQYIGTSKDGQEYLEQFILDTVPEYYYSIEDVSIKKTISIEYGHNTVAVCYEIENGSEDAILKVVPLFNYREAGETSERGDLKFDVKTSGKILTLIPEKDKNIKIDLYTSEGDF